MATAAMRAVVLDGPGPASALQIRKIPVPTPRAGWALVAVRRSASTVRSCTPALVSPKA